MANALTSKPGTADSAGVRLEQLLHGYSEGHRLLQGSTRLPDDASRVVLRMSDLSGSGVAKGFEEYITGYPLPAINAYALAKTWYAPEMPRPGCVWTHTILIPHSALSEIKCLWDLVGLFQRPAHGATLDAYSRALPRNQGSVEGLTGVRPRLPIVPPEIFCTIYEQGSKPVVIGSSTSKEFEAVIFALWSQQWPSLRRDFTFCTGALGARSLGGAPFNVQCAPVSALRSVVLEITAASGGDPVLFGAPPVAPSPWALRAAADAANCSGGELREFLWDASDDTTVRENFAGLVTLFESLNGCENAAGLLSEVLERFPEAKSGARLKSLLFGEAGQRNYVQFDEAQLLLALGTTDRHPGLDAEQLKVNERGKALCLRDAGAARQLLGDLFRSNLNPLGEEMLAGLISALDPETARRVTADQPQFLPAVFRAKPSLASSHQLWEAAGHRKWDLFEAVAGAGDLDAVLVGKITVALLDAGGDFLLRRALEKWGKSAVWGVLDWATSHAGKMPESCRGPLTFHIASVMEWVEADPNRLVEGFVAAAHVVAPYSYDICQHDARVWQNAFRKLREQSDERESTYLGLFVFTLGLGNAPPSPVEFISETFGLVHEAARQDLLGDDVWVIAEPLVPHLSWIQDWDKCERLRRGLVSAFVRHGWPASDVRKCVRDERLLRQVLESARKVDGGKAFLQEVE
jgi:hypothetical protein